MLKKDCDCVTHDGPHWLHVDKLHSEANQKLKNSNDIILAARGFAIEECARLEFKRLSMVSRGIEELLEDAI